jgi:hypothetical protein
MLNTSLNSRRYLTGCWHRFRRAAINALAARHAEPIYQAREFAVTGKWAV